MAFNLSECQFTGPALPEPFVKFELEKELAALKLLPKTSGEEGKAFEASWNAYKRVMRLLQSSGGSIRVFNHIIEPLLSLSILGYDRYEPSKDIQTREEMENGGWVLTSPDGTSKLRVWATEFDADLLSPSKRGRQYRFSPLRIAQRVLLATGERLGILTNGVELLLLISDPARPDSTVSIPIDTGWRRSRDIPDSFRFLVAMASPAGVAALPDLVDKARLQQARVTKELRTQAREAVRLYIQEVLDHPSNREWLAGQTNRDALAKALWREGLVTVYRLLFILKLESANDAARSFSFASTSLWRNTFSPTVTLARFARKVLDDGAQTGSLLEDGMKSLFRMFESGLECTELVVKPLGGALFGPEATPILSSLAWGEHAVAHLLDQLLWTARKKGSTARERVHYGPLDVEDLGRVYEALLELEPGITTEPMCRLRRQKLEVVVPMAQGEKYKPADPTLIPAPDDTDDTDTDEDTESDEDEAPVRGKKTKVEWIEAIQPGKFFLRVGLGRKSTGSYYTPHSFVRFLVQETLGPQVKELSPEDYPNPVAILSLRVLDPAMGSGHFLVEACRFLGEKLYEACRFCDEKATEWEQAGDMTKAAEWIDRVRSLPDPYDEMLNYLPSRAPERIETGLSSQKALALCRRLVATHCLYGVDKNPLAVELAKLALWLESHAEGMPLTFMDHRLVVGDSLTGPFWPHLIRRPGKPKEYLEDIFTQRIGLKLASALHEALQDVGKLEATVGTSLSDIANKQFTKADLDRILLPFRIAAAAWSGGVMLGSPNCDDMAYAALLQVVANTGDLPPVIQSENLRCMIARGLGVEEVPAEREALVALVASGKCVPALAYDLTFPEVFYPTGNPNARQGFHAVLGNPPWDRMLPADKEFFASYEFSILDAPTKRERDAAQKRLLADPGVKSVYDAYIAEFRDAERIFHILYEYQIVEIEGEKTIGKQDAFRAFMERNAQLLTSAGLTGVVVPAAFHANEGATGVRRLYLKRMALHCCYSFENRRKLFEIHSSFKFATVVARKGKVTDQFSCGFYLHDDEWLFGSGEQKERLTYKLDFVERTGGEYLSLLELRSAEDLDVAEVCFANGEPFGRVCERLNIRFGRELHITDDASRFTPTVRVLPDGDDPRDPMVAAHLLAMGYLVLHEGKAFHQFWPIWDAPPIYLLSVDNLVDKELILHRVTYYTMSQRGVSGSTNERTAIFCILPPGAVTGHNNPVDKTPEEHPAMYSLIQIGILNSFPTDFILRLIANIYVSKFILDRVSIPKSSNSTFNVLVHNSLRLSCSHAGYAPLWHEQVGDAWREPGKAPFTWPVLAGDDERWAVRAAIDAVVAEAYGLSKEQYAHVLSTFSHKSYRQAPELCLARFDELKELGTEAFCRKWDPYHDIPLNESLPKPVIELPGVGEVQEGGFQFTNEVPKKRKKGR